MVAMIRITTHCANKRLALIILATVIITGAVLRFWGLSREAFWFNEAASYSYAKGTAWEIIKLSYTEETNPPGFHLLVHFWGKIAGISEWALRFPSALAGCLSLVLMYLFARVFLERNGSVIATALFAFSPLHIWYSQECRCFSIWVFFILAAYLCFFKWEKTGRRLFLVLNGLFITLATSFHYFGLHVVIIENVFLLATRNSTLGGKWKAWIISQALLFLAVAPFVAMMMMVDRTHVAWWEESGVKIQAVKALFFHLNGAFFFLTHERVFKLAILLLNALTLTLGLYTLRRSNRLVFLVAAVCSPIVLNLSYSLLVSPIFGNSQSAGRYFLFTLPPYLVILAAGWEYLSKRMRRPKLWGALMGVFLVLCLLGVRAGWRNTIFTRDNNRRLCGILLSGAREGDYVIAAPYVTLDYYAARLGYDIDNLRVISTSRFDDGLQAKLPADPERLWMLFDPVHHFESLVSELVERYDMTVMVDEREHGIDGVGLFLLESRPAKE